MSKEILSHLVTGDKESMIIVISCTETMDDSDVNEYMVEKGFPSYKYIKESRVTDHVQGTVTMMYRVTNELFDTEDKMFERARKGIFGG